MQSRGCAGFSGIGRPAQESKQTVCASLCQTLSAVSPAGRVLSTMQARGQVSRTDSQTAASTMLVYNVQPMAGFPGPGPTQRKQKMQREQVCNGQRASIQFLHWASERSTLRSGRRCTGPVHSQNEFSSNTCGRIGYKTACTGRF